MMRRIALTLAALAVVVLTACETRPATNIHAVTGGYRATLNGYAGETSDSGYYRFFYCPDANMLQGCATTPNFNGTGPFAAGTYNTTFGNNTGLLATNTTYYFRLEFRHSQADDWTKGDVLSFTTGG